ncbi:hypothetical protein PVAND_004962 [Polypedilum vanderplanki]|uniref:Uncharacterized protein n=1 Tax=Polypedilum vanderplanki TaxID=319348 RepID=A0A9J6C0L4_POLVA|nr:hypothetical protein PVAND_004962 [Polypedilum vanderplanki]
MKLFIIFMATAVCTINCAQLNNNYLPPAGASGSSGSGVGLQTPKIAGANVPISSAGRTQSPSQTSGRPAATPSAPSQPNGPPIEILSYENVNNGDGSFKWSFQSANGIKAEEMGDVKNKGSENAIQTVQGSYSYTSPEGNLIQITYTADEKGFSAVGDAIPTPVPLPEENLRAIAEFEAALATAVPEPASASSVGNAPRPGTPSINSSAGASRPGQQSPSPPSSAAASGFGSQTRPGGGSGSYSPQSGYKY